MQLVRAQLDRVLETIGRLKRLVAELDASRSLEPMAYWEAVCGLEDVHDAVSLLQEAFPKYLEAHEAAHQLELLASRLNK